MKPLKPLCWVAAIAATGCTNGTFHEGVGTGSDRKAESVDPINDPDRLGVVVNRQWAELPAAGEAERKPFPANWWPMSQNGIAQRWQGAGVPSPAEKYDMAFNVGQRADVAAVSHCNFSDRNNPSCTRHDHPAQSGVGPAFAWELREHGVYDTYHPLGWFGHCNGWAAYSINEPEPTHAVEHGGVRFETGDINALMSELYWDDYSRGISARCEKDNADWSRDDAGRLTHSACRDANPASLHLVATNLLGTARRAFVIDLAADFEVWNFPAYRFELVENREVSLAEALSLLGVQGTTYPYNPAAGRFAAVRAKLWIVEDSLPPSTQPSGHLLDQHTTIETYDYLLEMDQDGLIIGGEWLGQSRDDHPDFIWVSLGHGGGADDLGDLYDNPHVDYQHVKDLLTRAAGEEPGGEDLAQAVDMSRSPDLAIPDAAPAGVADTITTSATGTVTHVVLDVDIAHTYVGDLVVALRHEGVDYVVHGNEGGSADDIVRSYDLADAFDGVPVRGDWTLAVKDVVAVDTGRLRSWRLRVSASGSSGGGGSGGGGGGGSETGLLADISRSPGLAIPDANSTGVGDTATVDSAATVTRVEVSVEITHTYIGDLRVALAHGTREHVLHNRAGGGADDLSESYAMEEAFAGLAAGGSWTLRVSDLAGQDVGTLVAWRLKVYGSTATAGETVARTPALPIPDNDPTGVADTATIGASAAVSRVLVSIDITHPYVGDLRVSLLHGSVEHVLHDRTGGSADDLRQDYAIETAFDGAAAGGAWTLKVADLAAADVGVLASWTLRVE